eukprot:Tamp_21708.p1 GENE.Tamp_21708~~Tamp_21708.p1  ORF type:complete len:314 (+),score=39.74 Tamp_21708:48-989(+)
MVTTRRQRQIAENTAAGLFPEGGLIDRLDKALSGPIFRLRVSMYVEAVIAVPGSMFGVMLQSLIMLPSWLPLILGFGNVRYVCLVTVPVHAWGATRILRWMDDPSNKELVFCSTLMPAVGFVHMALCTLLCGRTDASAAISFWVCTWFYSQLANQAIKNVFWRRRPIACLSEKEGQLAPRHFPQFKIMLSDRPDCLESFPSGDAAGAGGFGYTLLLFTGNPLWLMVTIAACFGRVFLHVHHVLDVSVGAFVGVYTAYLLDWWIEGGCRLTNAQHLAICVAFSMLMFGVFLPAIRRRKREEQLAKGIQWGTTKH